MKGIKPTIENINHKIKKANPLTDQPSYQFT